MYAVKSSPTDVGGRKVSTQAQRRSRKGQGDRLLGKGTKSLLDKGNTVMRFIAQQVTFI